MLIKEILKEDYNNQMDSFVLDLVMGYQASGIREIPLDRIVKELNESGFQVDKNFLVQFFSDPKRTNMGIQVDIKKNIISLNDVMHDEDHGEKVADDQNKIADKAKAQAQTGTNQ